jgi:hypothetical protein
MKTCKLFSLLAMVGLFGAACGGSGSNGGPPPSPASPTSPIHAIATPAPLFENGQVYRAEGLYAVTFPADQYATEQGQTVLGETLGDGVAVLRPKGDQAGYMISIAVSALLAPVTLDNPQGVIDQSVLLRYQPEIVQVRLAILGGQPAIRLDNLRFGEAGFAIHILTIRDNKLYEILVQPQPSLEDDPQLKTATLIVGSFQFLAPTAP